MPGPHKFWADEGIVGVKAKEYFNLGPYDRETALVLAHALNRLNALLSEEIIGTHADDVIQHSNVSVPSTEKQALSAERLTIAINQTSAKKDTAPHLQLLKR
jgi:hypothetical protein